MAGMPEPIIDISYRFKPVRLRTDRCKLILHIDWRQARLKPTRPILLKVQYAPDVFPTHDKQGITLNYIVIYQDKTYHQFTIKKHYAGYQNLFVAYTPPDLPKEQIRIRQAEMPLHNGRLPGAILRPEDADRILPEVHPKDSLDFELFWYAFAEYKQSHPKIQRALERAWPVEQLKLALRSENEGCIHAAWEKLNPKALSTEVLQNYSLEYSDVPLVQTAAVQELLRRGHTPDIPESELNDEALAFSLKSWLPEALKERLQRKEPDQRFLVVMRVFHEQYTEAAEASIAYWMANPRGLADGHYSLLVQFCISQCLASPHMPFWLVCLIKALSISRNSDHFSLFQRLIEGLLGWAHAIAFDPYQAAFAEWRWVSREVSEQVILLLKSSSARHRPDQALVASCLELLAALAYLNVADQHFLESQASQWPAMYRPQMIRVLGAVRVIDNTAFQFVLKEALPQGQTLSENNPAALAALAQLRTDEEHFISGLTSLITGGWDAASSSTRESLLRIGKAHRIGALPWVHFLHTATTHPSLWPSILEAWSANPYPDLLTDLVNQEGELTASNRALWQVVQKALVGNADYSAVLRFYGIAEEEWRAKERFEEIKQAYRQIAEEAGFFQRDLNVSIGVEVAELIRKLSVQNEEERRALLQELDHLFRQQTQLSERLNAQRQTDAEVQYAHDQRNLNRQKLAKLERQLSFLERQLAQLNQLTNESGSVLPQTRDLRETIRKMRQDCDHLRQALATQSAQVPDTDITRQQLDEVAGQVEATSAWLAMLIGRAEQLDGYSRRLDTLLASETAHNARREALRREKQHLRREIENYSHFLNVRENEANAARSAEVEQIRSVHKMIVAARNPNVLSQASKGPEIRRN